MSECFVVGWDPGQPGGDRTVAVVFDTLKREIVSLQVWTEESWIKAERIKDIMLGAELEAIADRCRIFSPNPAGVDNQGEARVVDP